MKTIFEHTQSNVLVIPQALFAMQDVTVLRQHKNSAIFYKSLEQDLVDIEFYTNTPCFIYISRGREVITNSNNETIELREGAGIFLPQGLSLHSDFVKETTSLKAYLVFFDDEVVLSYLSKIKPSKTNKNHTHQENPSFCLIEGKQVFNTFFDSLLPDIQDPAYLNIKLQELLHLVARQDEQGLLQLLLSTRKRVAPKQNFVRLLEALDVVHLTVSDLANISGRSLSSFNRDFKDAYQETPKKWLQDKKLSRAKELLLGKELSVTDVALTIGYDNVSAFIKAFKLKYGVTPKQIKLAE